MTNVATSSAFGSCDHINVAQASSDLAGSYTNLSDNIILPGSGDVTTNYLDVGGATNVPARFYRIRRVP